MITPTPIPVTILGLTPADLRGWIAVGISITALIVSLLTLFLNRWDKKERLGIYLSIGRRKPRAKSYIEKTEDPENNPRIIMQAVNLTEKTITISGAGILWKKKTIALDKIFDLMPYEIGPHHNWSIDQDITIYANHIRNNGGKDEEKIRAFFDTTLGTRVTSKKIILHIDKWATIPE